MYKIYITRHLPGVGRAVLIACEIGDGANGVWESEGFLFMLDSECTYEATRSAHRLHDVTPQDLELPDDFRTQEMISWAEAEVVAALVAGGQAGVQYPEFKSIGNEGIFHIITAGCIKELNRVHTDTRSQELVDRIHRYRLAYFGDPQASR